MKIIVIGGGPGGICGCDPAAQVERRGHSDRKKPFGRHLPE